MKIKTKSWGLPFLGHATTKTYNPNNYANTRMAGVVYGNKNQKIKQTKTTVNDLPWGTYIKTKTYGPANYYGKQTKNVSRKFIKK